MPLKQENRLLNLKTALGENVLVLTSFRGREEISRLFQFQLEMTSDNNAIQAKDIVGTNVTFRVNLADGSPRHFNGFVSRFSAGDEDEKGRRDYRAEIVPWLWFLSRTADCRIFQDKTIPDIIKQIFSDLGFSDFDDSQIKGTHPKHVYRVQYRETDFNFVSRLMEEEGIFYYFKHEDGKHTLVLADHKGAYADCPEKEVDYPSITGSHSLKGQLSQWEHRYEFRTGKIAQTDYNFETPSTSLMTNEPSVVKIPGMDKYEFYDYPGMYPNTGDGRPLTRLRMEEEEAGHDVVHGAGTCRTFSPGHKFKVGNHRSASEEGKSYVLTSVQHSASESMPHETGRGGREEEEGYQNTFTCIPDSVTFRPARITRRPFVQGLQTAVVVGPAGEEIYPDEYGRVKVQFFWDREGKKDEKSSCWVRVSQNWAGQSWGGMFIPHVGQEVIVDFLEGDPDRPIITGRVYNAEQTVPLPLPDEKTKCIIRDYGNNQMIWEGKPGEQYVRIDQECGNEFIMDGTPGQESIQLRDKFGNQLYLGAASKSISLFSPSHNSGIVLGRSAHTITQSDEGKVTVGNTYGVHSGSNVSVSLGFKTGFSAGSAFDCWYGPKAGIAIGRTIEYAKGSKVAYSAASSYAKAAEDSALQAEKDVAIDANDTIWLLGGNKDKSQIKMNDDALIISFMDGSSGRTTVEPPSWKSLAGTVTGVALNTAAAGAQLALGLAGYVPNQAKNDIINVSDDNIAKMLDGGITTALGFATMAFSGVEAHYEAKRKEEQQKANKVRDLHGSPDGKIIVDKKGVTVETNNGNGTIKLEKDGNKITLDGGHTLIRSEGEITLQAANEVVVICQGTNYKKGYIRQKNFSSEG